MIRAGLTVYLAFVTLVGPWLCCCTTTRAVAGLLPVLFDRSDPAQPRASGCCHRGSVADRDARSREPAPVGKDSKSPLKPCPCRDGEPAASLASVTGAAGNVADLVRLFAFAGDVGLPAELPAPAAAPAGDVRGRDRSGQFLTTRDLLRAHHVLRC